MFDISWSEFLLIGIVALIVIGPKELPAVMRTLGQWTRKVRNMASEFQGQFQEAMREAEMADLKEQVDDLARGVKDSVAQIDPLKDLREDVAGVGGDVKRSLGEAPEPNAALPEAAAEPAPAPAETQALEAAAVPAAETPPVPPVPTAASAPSREIDALGAEAETGAAKSIEEAAQADGTGRPA